MSLIAPARRGNPADHPLLAFYPDAGSIVQLVNARRENIAVKLPSWRQPVLTVGAPRSRWRGLAEQLSHRRLSLTGYSMDGLDDGTNTQGN